MDYRNFFSTCQSNLWDREDKEIAENESTLLSPAILDHRRSLVLVEIQSYLRTMDTMAEAVDTEAISRLIVSSLEGLPIHDVPSIREEFKKSGKSIFRVCRNFTDGDIDCLFVLGFIHDFIAVKIDSPQCWKIIFDERANSQTKDANERSVQSRNRPYDEGLGWLLIILFFVLMAFIYSGVLALLEALGLNVNEDDFGWLIFLGVMMGTFVGLFWVYDLWIRWADSKKESRFKAVSLNSVKAMLMKKKLSPPLLASALCLFFIPWVETTAVEIKGGSLRQKEFLGLKPIYQSAPKPESRGDEGDPISVVNRKPIYNVFGLVVIWGAWGVWSFKSARPAKSAP